ncbi:MAG: sigmaK-factor processing regulatory BofA [Candidatus Diapherotrites archaeon CG11_big_fil_rev_8_21_14_0_20_37_9]|nr:MAG: sigmaK-factor processing regulatory BofA [Candidatus Diapherotrites archaeon CG11_big_fil_rev_8_21_14_0_20_37_9]
MAPIPFLEPILTAFLLVLVVFFALKLGKKLIVLAINSFLGLVVLVLLNFFPFVQVDINIWSILIAGLGGIPGILIIIILSTLGWAF